MNSGPTVHRGSGTSAGSPPGSLNESQSRSMVHFCVSRRVRERGWRGQKKEKRRKRVFRTHKAIHIGPYHTTATPPHAPETRAQRNLESRRSLHQTPPHKTTNRTPPMTPPRAPQGTRGRQWDRLRDHPLIRGRPRRPTSYASTHQHLQTSN